MSALASQVQLNGPLVLDCRKLWLSGSRVLERKLVCLFGCCFGVFLTLVFVSTAFSYLACGLLESVSLPGLWRASSSKQNEQT